MVENQISLEGLFNVLFAHFIRKQLWYTPHKISTVNQEGPPILSIRYVVPYVSFGDIGIGMSDILFFVYFLCIEDEGYKYDIIVFFFIYYLSFLLLDLFLCYRY